MTQAQASLEFIPPKFNPVVWKAGKLIAPIWLHYRNHIAEIEIDNADELINLHHQFQAGKTRFLLAFRHPSINDPACIAQLLWNKLPQIAKTQNTPLKSPVHAHFVYDRGIPLWAGKSIGWLFSRLGGTPIRRGGLDRLGLRSIRNLYLNGRFPIAAAPEGATNGHNEIVSSLEPGIAQFGFWCAEDLKKAKRPESVAIAPLGIRYYFITPPWKSLESLLAQLEVDSGIDNTSTTDMNLTDGVAPTPEQEEILYQRLYGLGEHLLCLLEEFYSKFYQQNLNSSETKPELPARLQALSDAALNVAEQALGIKAKGNTSDRCRRVEQAAWDRIYRQDLDELENLAPVPKGLADLVASEAQLRLWHMRLVENFVSVTGQYVAEKPTVERFADTILLIWKMIARLKGKDANNPPFLGYKRAKITALEPFWITDYWEDYQANRRQTVEKLTQDLQVALETAIIDTTVNPLR